MTLALTLRYTGAVLIRRRFLTVAARTTPQTGNTSGQVRAPETPSSAGHKNATPDRMIEGRKRSGGGVRSVAARGRVRAFD